MGAYDYFSRKVPYVATPVASRPVSYCFIEGEIKGEIQMIRTLQGLLGVPLADEEKLRALSLEQLQAITSDLQEKLRNRTPG